MSDVLVHDWIEKNGGAEKVLDALVDAFPEANVLTLWNDAPHRYAGDKVVESPLARTPLRGRKALSVPIQAMAWRGAMFGRADVDRIIVSSHLFAHHIGNSLFRSRIPKYVYVHTPARYMWEPDLDKRGNHPALRAASAILRPLDRKRANEATALAANSQFVRKRIQRCWDMDARVIYPPVDINRVRSQDDWRNELSPSEQREIERLPREFLLGASRFVPYKRLDLVIESGELSGVPVVLAGSGPDYPRLRQIADNSSVPVTFIDSPSDALLYALYQQASAYVFPAVEDFGIMPVEAMAAGCPVLCNVEGGAGESVAVANVGERVNFADPEDIKRKIERVLGSHTRVNPDLLSDFELIHFQDNIKRWVDNQSPASLSPSSMSA